MPSALVPSDLDIDAALRIVDCHDMLARACSAAEPWRLAAWARGAAERIGALSARRIDRALRLELPERGGAPRVASDGRTARDTARACRAAVRALRESPADAAPRFAAWTLTSLATVRGAAPEVELLLLDGDAVAAPFEATVVRGTALGEMAAALLALAASTAAGTDGAPRADPVRLAAAAATLGPDAARALLLALLGERPLDGRQGRPVAARPSVHRLVARAIDAATDRAGARPARIDPHIAPRMAWRNDARTDAPIDARSGPSRTLPSHADDPLAAHRAAHRAALDVPFDVRLDAAFEAGLDDASVRRLGGLGTWYERLTDGRLVPISDAQHRFVSAARGLATPSGEHERLWAVYRAAIARLDAPLSAAAMRTADRGPDRTERVDPAVPVAPAAAAAPIATTVTAAAQATAHTIATRPLPTCPALHPIPDVAAVPPPPAAHASASTRMLASTTARATEEERLELTRALAGHDDAPRPLDPVALAWRIGLAGHRGLPPPRRPGGATYLEMLRDAAEVLAVDSVWWSAREAPGGGDLAAQDLVDANGATPRERDIACSLHAWIDELETEVLKAVLGLLQPAFDDLARSRFVRDLTLRARRHGLDLGDAFTDGGVLDAIPLGGFATCTALATALAVAATDRPALAGRTLASSLLCALLGPDGAPLLDPQPGWRSLDAPARLVARLVAVVAMIRQGAATSASGARRGARTELPETA
ncbi:MAG: hypothetical protein RJA99_5057 [Pseudomonadota bacterium]|jgi:hypothetical protein